MIYDDPPEEVPESGDRAANLGVVWDYPRWGGPQIWGCRPTGPGFPQPPEDGYDDRDES